MVCVSSPLQTKAAIVACLIEILIAEKNSEKISDPESSNPELLVLAPNWKRVEELSEFAKKILEKRKSRLKIVNLYRPGSEFEKCVDLLEGPEILFATPPSLAQLIRTDPVPRLYLDVKSAKFLIIDDVSKILATHRKKIFEIFEETKNFGRIFLQKIGTAAIFDPIAQNFFDGLRDPLRPVLIVPLVEASILHKLETKIFLVEQKKSVEKLKNLLKNFKISKNRQKIVIFLNQNEKTKVFEALRSAGHSYVEYDLNKKSSNSDSDAIFLIPERILNENSSAFASSRLSDIRATVLVHFGLPKFCRICKIGLRIFIG